MLVDCKVGAIKITWVDGVSGSVSKDLLNHNEPILLTVEDYEKKKGE